MTRGAGRLLALGLGGALAILLAYLYRQHRSSLAREAEDDAPVVAPSRVREVDGRGAIVVLDSADRRRVGIATYVLPEASAPAGPTLAGEVVADPDRTTDLRAPVAGRLRVPPGARWPRFGERVAAGVAIAQVSDARPLALPFGGTVTRVGARPGEFVAAGEVLLEVADLRRPVIRVALPADIPPPPTVGIQVPGTHERVPARLAGAALEADPLTRRPAFLYRAARGWSGAVPGTPVIASAPRGAGSKGVVVPDRAVVQWEGLAWAYRQVGHGGFERVRVPLDRPVPGGWLASPPWTAGDTVVVVGAQQLLSEEFRARVTVGDEAGE